MYNGMKQGNIFENIFEKHTKRSKLENSFKET